MDISKFSSLGLTLCSLGIHEVRSDLKYEASIMIISMNKGYTHAHPIKINQASSCEPGSTLFSRKITLGSSAFGSGTQQLVERLGISWANGPLLYRVVLAQCTMKKNIQHLANKNDWLLMVNLRMVDCGSGQVRLIVVVIEPSHHFKDDHHSARLTTAMWVTHLPEPPNLYPFQGIWIPLAPNRPFIPQ